MISASSTSQVHIHNHCVRQSHHRNSWHPCSTQSQGNTQFNINLIILLDGRFYSWDLAPFHTKWEIPCDMTFGPLECQLPLTIPCITNRCGFWLPHPYPQQCTVVKQKSRPVGIGIKETIWNNLCHKWATQIICWCCWFDPRMEEFTPSWRSYGPIY